MALMSLSGYSQGNYLVDLDYQKDIAMKLATMTSVCPDWDIETIVTKMKEYGYQGLEPRVGWKHKAGIELDMPVGDRSAVRKLFAENRLEICCISTGAKFASPDEEQVEASVNETLLAIDLASDLGSPCVRTFGGARGGGELTGIVQRTIKAYQRVIEYAEEKQVTILMETHDEWCTSTQVRAVVEGVNHPRLQVLWDIMHPQRVMERPDETMKAVGALTKHVHIHDGIIEAPDYKVEVVALGEGVIDHATPFRMLQDAGYAGYLSVEVIYAPGSEHDSDATMSQYASAVRSILA